ncbi:MAG: preprotein translocase subunit SecG [Patescibacteria group bacterium]|jgi:protein translocase SecG subunit
MSTLRLVISIAQVVVVILFIITVLLQQKGVGLGSAFGGGDSVYTTRRGPEKFIFNAGIVLAVLFLGLGIANIFIK